MVEALPLRAMRFNHEIAAASMAKRSADTISTHSDRLRPLW
jgi:hypothetical protein